jgi:hypothetical protein
MAIIGINGYASSGKDTVGIILQYLNSIDVGNLTIEDIIKNYSYHEWWLEEQSGWEIKKWAGKLKQVAELLTGIPVEKFEDQEFKKTYLGKQWNDRINNPMSVRDFLQKLGTEGLRDGLHTNTWVNALMADYKCVPADRAPNGWDCPNWIITDTRFPNEAQAIKDAGGIIIRVTRPGIGPINDHPSETGLNQWKFDYEIQNDGTLENLINSVRIFKQKFGI